MAKSLQEFKQFVLQKYPDISKEQLNQLDDFISTQQAREIAGGGVPLEKIQTDPALRAIQAEQVKTGTYKAEPTKEEIKGENTQKVLDNLSSLFYGKEGEKSLGLVKPGEFRLPAQVQGFMTGIKAGKEGSIEKRIYEYNRLKQSKMAFLAKAYGDTGNIAYQEQLNAIKSLPDVGSTPGEALTLWDTAYSSTGTKPSKRIQTEFEKAGYQRQADVANIEEGIKGGSTQAQSYDIEGPTGMMLSAGNALTDFLIPETKKIPERIVKEEQRKQERLQTRGSSKGDLLKSAQYALEDTLGVAKIGVPAGVELALLKGAPGLLKAGGSKIAEVTGKIFKPRLGKEALNEGLNLIKEGGKLRSTLEKTAEEMGKKIEGNNFFKAVEQWGKEAKRTRLKTSEIKAIDDVVKNAERYKGKLFTPSTVRKMWDTAESGFTAAGKVGDDLTAQYNLTLRNAARTGLEGVAKGWEKGTSMIKKGIEEEKTLKAVRVALEREGIKSGLKSPGKEFLKIAGKVTGTAALSGAAFYALNKLLGGQNQ